jgi:hypothetical protein
VISNTEETKAGWGREDTRVTQVPSEKGGVTENMGDKSMKQKEGGSKGRKKRQ